MVRLREALAPFAIALAAAAMTRRRLPPGLMIAAPRSGSGKTTLTLGLLRAFRRAGVAVGSAKCGPDYIDPAVSPRRQRAAQRQSRFLGDAAGTARARWRPASAIGCDLVLCEALMGLFDGVPGPPGRTGSSADVAAALGWPVLLVLDVSGQSQSAAAIVKGCATYDPRVTIAGVVLNRVGSPRHARLATEAIEALGIPVVGALPRLEGIALPERHLGLVQAGETSDLDARLDAHRRLRRRAHAARRDPRAGGAGPASRRLGRAGRRLPPPGPADRRGPGRRVLVPLSACAGRLAPAGAEIRFFSPLADEAPAGRLRRLLAAGRLPRTARRTAGRDRGGFFDGLRRLRRNPARARGMRRLHGARATPLTDAEGTIHADGRPVWALDQFRAAKTASRLSRGAAGCRWLPRPAGTRLRGHEFHYASIETPGDDPPFATVADAYGARR